MHRETVASYGENGRHWDEIDFLYALGIILVLIGHSHSSDWTRFEGSSLYVLILFIYSFHMPLFFFLAGFLFQNSNALRRKGFSVWIKEKAVRLLTPYFFWSFVAAVPKLYLENGNFSGIGTALSALVINPRASVWGHFWFLPVLFLTYAIYGALCTAVKNEKALMAGTAAAGLLFFYSPIETDILGLADLKSSLLFFQLGMAFRGYADKLSIRGAWMALPIFATLVSFLLTRVFHGNRTANLFVAILMIFACWTLASMAGCGRLARWLSAHNFTLYIFSWFFQAAVMAVCDHAGLTWMTTFVLMFTAGLIGPVIIVFLYRSFPVFHRENIRLVLGIR